MIYCKFKKKKGRWQKIKTKLRVLSLTEKMSTGKYPMGFREVSHPHGVTLGLSDFTVTEGFFSFFNQRSGRYTVDKIEDAKLSPTLLPHQGLAMSAPDYLGIQTVHSDSSPLETELLHHARPPTTHTCMQTHAATHKKPPVCHF